jgi:hypothetical protein
MYAVLKPYLSLAPERVVPKTCGAIQKDLVASYAIRYASMGGNGLMGPREIVGDDICICIRPMEARLSDVDHVAVRSTHCRY